MSLPRAIAIPAALGWLCAGCPTADCEDGSAAPCEPDLPPDDGLSWGEERTCDDPVTGWARFSEEAAARGVTGPLGGLWQQDHYEGFSSAVLHDLDADGDLDLIAGQQLAPPRLWWNDGAGHFSAGDPLPDAWSEDAEAYRAAAADLDGDGLPEILLLGQTLRTWRNLGDGLFDAPEEPALDVEGRLSSFALGDPDRDGDLDLLLVTSIAGPGAQTGPPDLLLLGDGAGGFTVGPTLSTKQNGGVSSLVALFTDRDLDGDQDLLEPTNTFDRLPQTSAFFRNDTEVGGALALVEDGAAMAVDLPMAGMGVDSMDLNRDGLLDYCVTDVGPSVCFLSQGAESPYVDATLTVGLSPAEAAYGPQVVPTIGWAFDFADLDNDGHPDALHTSAPDNGSHWGDDGYVLWPDLMFAGRPDGTFEDVTEDAGFGDPQANYGLATGDIDGDGALDVVVSGPGRPVQIHANRCTPGAWVEVELIGPPGNREGYGAIAWLDDSRGTQIRELYAVRATGQGPSILHFGLGEDASVARLRVRWPDGAENVAEDLPVRRTITARHPDAE